MCSQDLHSLRSQVGLLASLSTYTTQALLTHNAVQASTAHARTLLSLARSQLRACVAGSGRSALDLVPHQQLIWILEEVLAGSSGTSRGAEGGLSWPQLTHVVLPVLLHEMWHSWHSAAWDNTAAGGLLQMQQQHGGGGAKAGGAEEWEQGPARMYQVGVCVGGGYVVWRQMRVRPGGLAEGGMAGGGHRPHEVLGGRVGATGHMRCWADGWGPQAT